MQEDGRTSASLKEAMIIGCFVWLVYGIVEIWFAGPLLWAVSKSGLFLEAHLGFAAFSLGVYAATGTLVGGAIHLFRRTARKESVWIAATASLSVAYICNYLFHIPLALPVLPPLVVAAMVLAAAIYSLAANKQRNKLAGLINPWTASIAMIGLPWITRDAVGGGTGTMKAVAGAAFCLCLLALALIAARRAKVEVAEGGSLLRLALFSLLTLGAGAFTRQQPVEFAPAVAPASAGQPNIVMISLDTVGAGHMSAYGYERDTTPHLKALSGGATLYTRAVATSDITLSTHASLFSGLYPRVHGAHHAPPDNPLGRPLPASIQTLAEILTAKGYKTMGVVANHGFLSPGYALHRGFQHYDSSLPVSFLSHCKPYLIREGIRKILSRFVPPYLTGMVYRRAGEINAKVLAAMERTRAKDRPFFLFVNYMDAHAPYLPPPPFNNRYPGRNDAFDEEAFQTLSREVTLGQRLVTEAERAHMISQYDGGIAYTDHYVGELIGWLKANGIYDHTMIVVTADHGESFGERNLIEHGTSVYQEQVHVPLIVKFPGTNTQAVNNNVVSSVDVMPTILHAAGFPVPAGLQGRLLTETAKLPRMVYSESFPNPDWDSLTARFRRTETAVFSDSFKLIHSETGKTELFDIVADPQERNDLRQSRPEVARELLTRAKEWRKLRSFGHGSSKIDGETMERLRSLGYVQ